MSGIRVIDVTQNLSGPMATTILGDQGADIVKVEAPGIGDFTRAIGGTRRGVAPAFAVINRHKRSAAINLRDPRGLDLLKRMVARRSLVKTIGLASPSGSASAKRRCAGSNTIWFTSR